MLKLVWKCYHYFVNMPLPENLVEFAGRNRNYQLFCEEHGAVKYKNADGRDLLAYGKHNSAWDYFMTRHLQETGKKCKFEIRPN